MFEIKRTVTRATFIIKEVTLEKIKAMAYWDRVKIRQVTDRIFSEVVEKYGAENGPIQSIPVEGK
jgi:hypothetical protein